MIFRVNQRYFFPKRALRIERYYFDHRMSDETRKFHRHKGAHDCFRGRPLISAATEFEQDIWLEIGAGLIFGKTRRILKQDALTVGVALVHDYGPPIFAQN